VDPDLDDTVAAAGRPPAHRPLRDLDDTVVRGALRPLTEAATSAPLPVATAMGDTAPMPDAVVVEPPAARYGFRVGAAGRTVLLDAVVYVGRAPTSPRIQHGLIPKLVRVPSPKGEISGTHLEIRQLGASVVVTDLRSTNGSVVAVPGSEARALRQGESMVVTPGTLVDIGDGNVIEILPLQRQLGGFA
jgi:pSer/pThr/pTyr-binding forkhead associated (FHA) protein